MIKKWLIFLVLVMCATLAHAEPYIHHELTVNIDPENHYLEVKDDITIPAEMAQPELHCLLHGNLTITETTSIKKSTAEPTASDFGVEADKFDLPENTPYQHLILESPKMEDNITISLHYEGEIFHEIENISEEYARSFSETAGIISSEGVFLGGSSLWVPWFNEELITFNLTMTLPESWDVVSQGRRTTHTVENGHKNVRWESRYPGDEVFLIASQFTEYTCTAGTVTAMAFLQNPDDALANKYLEATAQYIEMYRQLIGPYPYQKFALVENFWETGYGMPSFTLLGPKVIRFPFILHSSYPHEILHNWWGNGVFVDWDAGNWCEGITAYLADHLIKEQRGQGADYRRSALQRYTDYVKTSSDFPLIEFRSRHDAATEAIGYGKAMMMYHMLRRHVGDELFVKSLQAFYRQYKFKKATFDDIQQVFESVTGEDFSQFFTQWTTWSGAPVLTLSNTQVKSQNGTYSLSLTLSQSQVTKSNQVYDLEIPIAVYLEQDQVVMTTVKMNQVQQDYELSFDTQPVQIQIDPEYDVFRKLHRNEIPPSLSQAFGADKVLMILPANDDHIDGYRLLAQTWERETTIDTDISELPEDSSVWILGWDNAFKDQILAGIIDYNANIDDGSVRFSQTTLSQENNSFVVTVRNPRNPDAVLVWLATDNLDAIPGLSRKLPHYGKYSYLAFEGDEPTNIAKGQWAAINSPMKADLVDDLPPTADLPSRSALAELPPAFSADRMMADIAYLASEELAGRGFGSEGLDQAADYIAKQFEEAGLQVIEQKWQDSGGKENQPATLRNIIGIIPGTKDEWQGQSVVISAHYDHLGLGWPDVREGNEGKIHYGADDNASGVAVMLELARTWGKTLKPKRTIIFAAFTGEESGLRGSTYYVENMTEYPVEKVMANINLDTVGRLGDQKLLILNGSSASEWKHVAMGIGFVTGIESEIVTQDIYTSDQVSFLKKDIPAIQLFTGAHEDYHCPSDTADKIDADGLVKVAMFTREAALYLSEREEPLTFAGTSKAEHPQSKTGHPGGNRSVSTGSMPDFSYSGEGVKIGAISEGSPAATAGLQVGDIIVNVAGQDIENLTEYTNVLKQHQPGDTTVFIYLRDGVKQSTMVTFTTR